MAKGDDIQERLVRVAVALVRICDQLPETRAGIPVASQLLRSGTSPAPNYAEARGAESDKDFVDKLKVVLKELNESLVWLGVIREGGLLDTSLLRPAEEECAVKKRCGLEKQSPGGGRGGFAALIEDGRLKIEDCSFSINPRSSTQEQDSAGSGLQDGKE